MGPRDVEVDRIESVGPVDGPAWGYTNTKAHEPCPEDRRHDEIIGSIGIQNYMNHVCGIEKTQVRARCGVSEIAVVDVPCWSSVE